MALSLNGGFRRHPPDVIRHRLSMEPGLSSPPAFRHWRGAAVRPADVKRNGGATRPRQVSKNLASVRGYWPEPYVPLVVDLVGGPPGWCAIDLVRVETSPL